MKIAIDGPAGAGKSTLARILAQRLGYIYIDTGAMYRAVTWKALQENLDISDEKRIYELAANTKIHFEYNSQTQKIICDNQDITRQIRSPEVNAVVSRIASFPLVREIMVRRQRELGRDNDVVMDGRDIGEVVLPDADYKFYITADIDERARRRKAELDNQGYDTGLAVITNELLNRDHTDSRRPVGALKILGDSLVVDTTDLTVEEVLTKILAIIRGE